MTREVELITTPEGLMQWMVDMGVFMDLSKSDIQLLLQYLEGNEYALGTDKDMELVRVSLASNKEEVVEYSLDELVDQVCDWNYALILDAEMQRNHPKGMDDFYEKQKMYETYKREETLLSRMYSQTKYAPRIEEFLKQVEQIIRQSYRSGPEKVTEQVTDKIRGYHAERVR